MDDLYDNLENFNEEITIAQLRDENRDLKLKLEEYSEALDKLQKEFDTLTTEHKMLEINYSSLLNTARAEIERKTQLISKLNIEKDAMVLNSIQNRNSPYNRRYASKNKGLNVSGNKIPVSNENSWKPGFPNMGSNERTEDKHSSLENTPSSNTNLSIKLLDIVNRTGPSKNIGASNMEVKKSMGLINDTEKARAHIRNRRKSMPVFSMDSEKFSTDDETVGSTESAKDYISTDRLDVWNQNKFQNEKPNIGSKICGHYEPLHDDRRRQTKQYDSDKYRSTEKFSQRYKRNRSSDRSRRGKLDHSQGYFHRQEFERRRKDSSPKVRRDSPPRGRRESPQIDQRQFRHRSRRETERSNSDRNHLEDFNKYKFRSQDKYPTKHKISYEFDQPSSKRMKPDSRYQHEEERWRNEKNVVVDELDVFRDMSCQSPDIHTEPYPQQQIKEIKLHTTLKLDDPRLSSKKYVLRTHDGKPELFTVESGTVDMKVIDTTGWKIIERIKMPDALVRRPVSPDNLEKNIKIVESPIESAEISNDITKTDKVPALRRKKNPTNYIENVKDLKTPDFVISESKSVASTQKSMSNDDLGSIEKIKIPVSTDELVNEVYMDIDNHLNDLSMESGELYDSDSSIKNKKNSESGLQLVESQKGECLKKLSNYKIPKKSCDKNRQITNNDKDKTILSEENQVPDQTDNFLKLSDNNKESTQKVLKPNPIKNDDKLSRLSNQNEWQSSLTAKYIVEGDLELSEDEVELNLINSDVLNDKQDSKTQNTISDSTYINKQSSEPLSKNKSEEYQHILNPNVKEDIFKKGNLKTVQDTKKEKGKRKSPKLKDNKEHKNIDENALQRTVKNTEYKENKKSVNIDEPKIVIGNHIAKKNNNKHQTEVEIPVNATAIIEKATDPEIAMKEHTENKDASIVNEIIEKSKQDKLEIKIPLENTDVVLANSAKMKNKKDPKEPKNIESSENMESLKRKEKKNKIKESPESTEIVQKKGKGNKSKDSLENSSSTTKNENDVNENTDAAASKKSLKKKESKIKNPFENVENATTTHKPVRKREKVNKTKELYVPPPTRKIETETKTKFSDLFGDSSSLISPEDLGLLPVTVVPAENYAPFFEDAQDASDLTSVRGAVVAAPMETTKHIVGYTHPQGPTANVATESPILSNEPIHNEHCVLPLESAPAEAETRNIYQNLQSVSLSKGDVLKTIIISTGVQLQCTLPSDENPDANNTNVDLHVMQCVKPIMQALATSTPHKPMQQNVLQAEIDQTNTNSRCNSATCDSRDASVDRTPVVDKSDNKAVDPQTNDYDAPDVRIFVRRRRKVKK